MDIKPKNQKFCPSALLSSESLNRQSYILQWNNHWSLQLCAVQCSLTHKEPHFFVEYWDSFDLNTQLRNRQYLLRNPINDAPTSELCTFLTVFDSFPLHADSHKESTVQISNPNHTTWLHVGVQFVTQVNWSPDTAVGLRPHYLSA